jgi:hypothetical protein
MTDLTPPPARLLTASQWAARWGVHRNTARARLRKLHEQYGDRVVHRCGAKGSYRASVEDLRRVAAGPSNEWVTQEQLTRALGEIWRALERLGTSSEVPKCIPSAQDRTGR